MDVETARLLQRHRQVSEEFSLRRAEPAAGPFDRGLGFGIHGFDARGDGVVMVAAHDQGSLLSQRHHLVDRPFGIGAIADDIAKADDALGALGARGIEACGKGLPVGVDVGEDGQPQYALRVDFRRIPDGTEPDGYQTIAESAEEPSACAGLPGP